MTLSIPYRYQFQPLPSEPPPPYTPSYTPSYTPRPPHSKHQHTLPTSKLQFLSFDNKRNNPHHPQNSAISRYGIYLTTLHHSVNSSTHLYRLRPRAPANSKPRIYAVKVIPSSSQLTSHFLFPESNTINSPHPNILLPFLPPIIDDAGNHHLITPYCTGGTLRDLIQSTSKLLPEEADCFFKQLLRGVAYLHHHYDHSLEPTTGTGLDLKLEDIYLAGEGTIQIKVRLSPSSTTQPHATKGPYYAPEVYRPPLPRDKTINALNPRAIDAWALGVIYLFMRTGGAPWVVAKVEEDLLYAKYVKERVQEGGFLLVEGLGEEPCRNVIYALLDPLPSRRLRISQALRSEWMYGVPVCEAGECGR
ncbi:kinase-like protein [Aspergillus homomorphus CBS 101889]|uniref:non-specific serine/threonine protein kinase n=1 Tax=Aspergillus homomorphus (strain CBS 101889) TaxID=1450537 RepID=A0A395HXB0_ASPHC|nr:kinase-like protein [Aspergillus homomorphus CBS 101889]RAL12562.1 kinase-like protein [Aspergillus homomorphus CBS 101889]